MLLIVLDILLIHNFFWVYAFKITVLTENMYNMFNNNFQQHNRLQIKYASFPFQALWELIGNPETWPNVLSPKEYSITYLNPKHKI